MSLLNEDGGLRVFFPWNSFVTNTTLTRTNSPRKGDHREPELGNDHIACYRDGHGPQDMQVSWHTSSGRTRQLLACQIPCGKCGSLCLVNGGVGVDPQDNGHTDIHMYTDITVYVNQDLECRVSSGPSAFIGVYLKKGGAFAVFMPDLQPCTSFTTSTLYQAHL